MVKFLPNELSAVDIINIALFNKAIRTAVNPYGRDAYQSRYGGRAVPWKMLKKSDKETTAEYLERLAEINSSVSTGLGNAIATSKRHTEKGVAAVSYSDGTMGVMPLKAAVMGYEGKNKNIVSYRAYPNAHAAAFVVRSAVPATVPVMA